MDQTEILVKSEDKGDQVSKTKTIYDVGALEIFWRNFLAGASRGLGGIFVYLVFLFIISGLFLNIVLPKLLPSINNFTNIFNSLGTMSNTKTGPGSFLPQNLDLQQLLGK